MKLSSLEIISERRQKLKSLRLAYAATVHIGSGVKVNCKAWYHGEEIDFCSLLSRSNVNAHLAQMVQHEINETVHSLEVHGIEVDE